MCNNDLDFIDVFAHEMTLKATPEFIVNSQNPIESNPNRLFCNINIIFDFKTIAYFERETAPLWYINFSFFSNFLRLFLSDTFSTPIQKSMEISVCVCAWAIVIHREMFAFVWNFMLQY